MRKKESHSCYFYLFFLLLTIVSCINRNKKSEMLKSSLNCNIHIGGKFNGNIFKFQYDSLSSKFRLSFNSNNPVNIFSQEYLFDNYGSLIEKRGLNFFAEEEVYYFDENNSLKEFRKLVKINKNKKGLQEFIRYRNGIIDTSKSHYFDFNIIDSSKTHFKIQLSYLGSFDIKKISIIINDFSFQTDEINQRNILISTENRSISFWVEKSKILDYEFNFFQINVFAEYYNTSGLFYKSDNSKAVKKHPIKQLLILRKFRKNMR